MDSDPGVAVTARIHRSQWAGRRRPKQTWVGTARLTFPDRFARFASYEGGERDCRGTSVFRSLLAELTQRTEEDDCQHKGCRNQRPDHPAPANTCNPIHETPEVSFQL